MGRPVRGGEGVMRVRKVVPWYMVHGKHVDEFVRFEDIQEFVVNFCAIPPENQFSSVQAARCQSAICRGPQETMGEDGYGQAVR